MATFALQSIVSTTTNRVEAVELLVRGDTHVSAMADNIVAGMSQREAMDVFATAVNYGLQIRREQGVELAAHVNLAADNCVDLVNAWNRPLDGLTVEICEGELSRELVDAVIAKIHKCGGMAALDDYLSSAWASPALLEHEWDVIKLDRSFWALDADIQRSAAMLTCERPTCIEGIETGRALLAAQELGFTLGQGFFMARPLVFPGAPRFTLHSEVEQARPLVLSDGMRPS